MKVSVYITSYNQQAWLIEAIDSVLGQTRPADQIIVVDDCSSDGSQDCIKAYAARHPGLFTVVLHERNLGVAAARVDALQVVTGDVVTFLDGDDRYLPHKLAQEAAVLESDDGVGFAFSNRRHMTTDMSECLFVWAVEEAPPEGDVFFETVTRRFPHENLYRYEMVRYQPWKEIGFHDTNLAIYEDYEMRIRLSQRLTARYIDRVASEVREHGGGLSRSRALRHLRSLQYLFSKHAGAVSRLPSEKRREVLAFMRHQIRSVARRAALDAFAERRLVEALRLLLEARGGDWVR